MRFIDVCKLLAEHEADIQDYLNKDEKGKLIPTYIAKLSTFMLDDYQAQVLELQNLTEKIQHIRDIVAAQQSLTKTEKITEVVSLTDVMDTALKMVGTQLSERGIQVKKNYSKVPLIKIDKSKLLQILVNFIQNAKDALIYDNDSHKIEKVVILSVCMRNDDCVVDLSVQDNGLGISKENLNKIFDYGFTTKKSGHGIGMHSSILAAKDIGTNISVESDGVGKGAKFTLSIPVNLDIEEVKYDSE